MKIKQLTRVFWAWAIMTLFTVQVGYAQYCYISPSKLNLKIGERATVKAEYQGYDGNWWGVGGDLSIAYITSPGGSYKSVEVTAVGEGSTYIECEIYRWIGATKDGHTFRCNITVTADSPSSITLDKTSLSMQMNETAQLTATISPKTASQKVNWEVLDEGFNVASVSSSGLVTAKAPGTATIRVSAAANSKIYKDCKVMVYDWPTSVNLDRTSLNLEIGDTAQLAATVLPEGADPSVTWTKESGSNVITLSSTGLVTAKEVGTVNVMAQSTVNSSAYKNCTVTVTEPTLKPGSWVGNTLTIGNKAVSSTNIAPYNSYYKYSTVQTLYTPTEIGKSGKIKSIAFRVANAANHSASKLRVYLGHKSSKFGSYVNSSDLTLVYSGSPMLGHAEGWETLVFNQGTFNYNGTDNLVVVITKEAPETTSALKYYCYYGNGYTLYRRSDSSSEYANVSNTSNSYTTTTYRPVIQIEFEGVKATGITLNSTSVSLKVGENKQLKATVLPNAASQSVTWSSDNADVVKVEDGNVTALSKGTANVTATTTDGTGLSATCKVMVKEPTPGPTPDEPDTDISQLDNVIYLEHIDVNAGGTATLSFKMKNSAKIRGFQFDLYLPEGVTAVKNNKGRIQGALSSSRREADDEHTLTLSEQADGAIRFLCGSQYDETFMGREGEVATLLVNIAEDIEAGDYPIVLKGMRLSETDISKFYDTEQVKSTLTVIDYMTGDINGDGVVNVSDYIGIANHILGSTPDGFNEKAADVNEDNTVNVSDYIGVANIILTGSPYGNNNVKAARVKAKVTDINTKDNVIYVEPTAVNKGTTQATLSFQMKNTAAIRGFQFDLYLPDGVKAAKSAKGRIQGTLSAQRLSEDDEHTLTMQEQADGAIRFLCGSQYDETFTGNEGEIATLEVNIAEDMAAGDYPIILRNMRLSETDISKFYDSDEVETTFTVKSQEDWNISLPSEITIDVCDFNYLDVEITPSDVETTLTWSSDDNDIVRVYEKGLILGNKPGKTKVCVKTANGLSAYCNVTVKDNEECTSLGYGTLSDNSFFDDEYETEVEIMKEDSYTNVYRIVRPYDGITNNDGGEYKGSEYMRLIISKDDIVYYDLIDMGYRSNEFDADVLLVHPYLLNDDESKDLNNKVLSYQNDGTPLKIQLAPLYYMPKENAAWDASEDENAIIITFPETETRINDISKEDEKNSTPIYNLSGQRVTHPRKGIYIQNGKKVLVGTGPKL